MRAVDGGIAGLVNLQGSRVVGLEAGSAGSGVRGVRLAEAAVDVGADSVLLLAEVPAE